MTRRVVTYELWPLNGYLQRLSLSALRATLKGADPDGSLSEGIPIFVRAGSVWELLRNMHLDGREVSEVEREVERALKRDGVWMADRAAIYRRTSIEP